MDKFANIDNAAHSGANGHNHKPDATPRQQDAGNYEKGRATLYGLRIAIETPRGKPRNWRAADGTSGSNLMKFHYGYIMGTLGNDGDELDVSLGPWPEAPRAFVVNQSHVKGGFDEHKIMLGFPDQRTAVAGYMSNYSAGWAGFGSCTACSIAQLKWWIANGNKKRPLTKDQLPYEGTDDTMEKVIWDRADPIKPQNTTLDRLLYSLRGHDANDGLLLDSVSMADILADADGVLALDALVIPFARIENRMAVMQKVLDRTGKVVKVAAMQVSDPFTQRGTTNVAVIYELTDGQTVSVFFHNPDVTPKKIAAADDLVSWKWMLNKKDITVAVAPEKGRDLDIRMVASRIMALAEKNSGRFVAANGKRAERLQSIAGLQTELDAKKATLAGLEQQVEAAQAARDAAGLGEPEEVNPDPLPVPEVELEPAAVATLNVDSIKAVLAYVDPMRSLGIASNWVMMNAPRPLLGTETMSDGEFLSGRFYAAIDPADSMAAAYLAENVKLDASVVFVADAETQQNMALNTINPEYLPAYMEMNDLERRDALSGFVQKLQGRTYGELKELAAKGMPVADMWKRDVEAFAFNRPGFFGRAFKLTASDLLNGKAAGTWTIGKMGDGSFAAMFTNADTTTHTLTDRSDTIEGAHAAMLAHPDYIAATAPVVDPQPSPQQETYREHLIYQTSVIIGGALEVRWAVRSEGRNDTLHPTVEAARAEVDLLIAQAESRAKQQALAAEEAAKEAAARAEFEDVDGFTDGMSPMQKEKALQALNATVARNGEVVTRKALIRERVAGGAVIGQSAEFGAILQDADGGAFNTSKQLTKTGMDYAAFLIAKRPVPEVTPLDLEAAADPAADEAAAKKAAEDEESADGDFLALASTGDVDFYDKAVTDRLAALARKYTDPDGAYLDLVNQSKTAAKQFFIAEFKKKVG